MLKLGADYTEYGILGTDGSKGRVGGMRINYCGNLKFINDIKVEYVKNHAKRVIMTLILIIDIDAATVVVAVKYQAVPAAAVTTITRVKCTPRPPFELNRDWHIGSIPDNVGDIDVTVYPVVVFEPTKFASQIHTPNGIVKVDSVAPVLEAGNVNVADDINWV